MSPGQLSTQRVDNLSVDKSLGKTDHMEEIGAAESPPVLFTQLSTQRVDNMFAIGRPLGHDDVSSNPLADRPVKCHHLRIDGRRYAMTATLDEQPDVFHKRWREEILRRGRHEAGGSNGRVRFLL